MFTKRYIAQRVSSSRYKQINDLELTGVCYQTDSELGWHVVFYSLQHCGSYWVTDDGVGIYDAHITSTPTEHTVRIFGVAQISEAERVAIQTAVSEWRITRLLE